jgi:ADP-dependent phosphofructokinase/glucokinase
MSDFTRSYLHKACEQLDAAMFSGDAFLEKENRDRLTYYMDRWRKHLPVWEAIETDLAASSEDIEEAYEEAYMREYYMHK